MRPWQHVLSPLGGYLRLAEALSRGPRAPPRARVELRPAAPATRSPVSWIVERLGELWGGALSWELDERPNPPEAGHLALDSSAAERLLGLAPARPPATTRSSWSSSGTAPSARGRGHAAVSLAQIEL